MRFIVTSFAFMFGILYIVSSADFVRAQDNPNADVERAVREEFSDIPVMISIARCESSYRQFNDDGSALNGGYGWMVGIYQIDKHIHGAAARRMGMNINTIKGNLAYARYLYTKHGAAPWLASSACWSKSRPSCAPSQASAKRKWRAS